MGFESQTRSILGELTSCNSQLMMQYKLYILILFRIIFNDAVTGKLNNFELSGENKAMKN